MTIHNAQIAYTTLGGWDQSIPGSDGPLTISLFFEGDGWGQGSGTFSGSIEAFITQVLNTVEAYDWSKLKGLHCRVRREDGRLVAVGHLIKERWFFFGRLYKNGETP